MVLSVNGRRHAAAARLVTADRMAADRGDVIALQDQKRWRAFKRLSQRLTPSVGRDMRRTSGGLVCTAIRDVRRHDAAFA